VTRLVAAAQLVDLDLDPHVGAQFGRQQLVRRAGGDEEAVGDLAGQRDALLVGHAVGLRERPPGQRPAVAHEGVGVVDQLRVRAGDDGVQHVVAVARGGVRALERVQRVDGHLRAAGGAAVAGDGAAGVALGHGSSLRRR